MPKPSGPKSVTRRKQMFPSADTQPMNKAQFAALTGSCGAFAAFIATGGEALVFVQRLAASLPL